MTKAKHCEHTNFAAEVEVHRLVKDDFAGASVPFAENSFNADVHVTCTDCGEPFRFIGFECGVSPVKAMVNFDATELRLPIQPKGRDMVGSWPTLRLSVRQTGRIPRA